MSDESASVEPRGPVATLRRIAFLMERQREETRRIEAFRNAARTILPLGEDEVRARAAAGTLTELPGIGPSTAAVITDACHGVVPERLLKLETTAGPLATGGEELRARLRGDLHSHSDWSDGGSPLEEMAMTAMELGHDYLVLTDHSPRLRVANGLSAERLARQLDVVDAVNEHLGGSFTLLKGIEVDILGNAKFFYNGYPCGYVANAVTPTVALAPHFGVRPKSAAAGKTLSIDYMYVASLRV